MEYSSGEESDLNTISDLVQEAEEIVLRLLLEEAKREEEEVLKKVLELERLLDAKRKLEMEIEELKGNVQEMKHLGDEVWNFKDKQEGHIEGGN